MTRLSDTANVSLHILIVDDNAASAQTTGWMVELMGHSYALADGAETAITAARDTVPDVVMLDIGLPGTNGFDLCRDMKAMPALSDAVFIAHSGYGDAKTRAHAAEIGFAHFLLKPFEPEDLEAMLTEAAARKG
jgi:CheY-like chemotaxis protein